MKLEKLIMELDPSVTKVKAQVISDIFANFTSHDMVNNLNIQTVSTMRQASVALKDALGITGLKL